MRSGTRYAFFCSVLSILAVFVWLSAFPALAEDAPPSGPVDARVVSAEGEVFVFAHDSPDDGSPADASDSTPLEAGDRIHTGADGRAEIGLEGDSILELGPNSDFTVTALEPQAPSFTLAFGSLVAKIKTMMRGSQMRINTPTCVAAVRGTEFGVDAAEDESETHVAVFDEGKVSVADPKGDGETTLEKNHETSVRNGARPGRAAALRHFLKMRQRLQVLRGRQAGLRQNWRRLDVAQRRVMRQQLRARLQNLPPERRLQLQQRMRQIQDRRAQNRERREQLRQKMEQRREKMKEQREQNQKNQERRREEREKRGRERQERRERPHGGRR